MNRPSAARCSPTGRGSHTFPQSDEPPALSPANGKMSDNNWKLYSNGASSPGGRSLTMSASMQDHLLPSSRAVMRSGEFVITNGNHRSDFPPSPDSLKLEISPSARARKGYVVPLGTSMVLCFVSAFLLLGMVGSRSRAYNLRLVPTLGIYRSHRLLQSEIPVDPFKGGIFGHDSVRLKELPTCDSSFEDHVPCYEQDTDSSQLPVLERRCPPPKKHSQCSIPPPDDYRIPPRWPESRNGVWRYNMKLVDQLGLSGRRLSRLKIGLREIGTLDLEIQDVFDFKQHVKQVLKTVAPNAVDKYDLGTVLDINCALSRFNGPYAPYEEAAILCLESYQTNGSQVQYALERGYPAFIGALYKTQLPIASSSFNMIHALDPYFNLSDGLILLELDRLLKPGGFLVLSLQETMASEAEALIVDRDMASNLCWSLLIDSPTTLLWRKTENQSCYSARGLDAKPKICQKMAYSTTAWYPPLRSCITISSTEKLARQSKQLQHVRAARGFSREELSDDQSVWAATVKSYWSLLTPLIFSDHPKRPGQEDPLPPSNIVHNILDMNAHHGSLNRALLDLKKSVWVMNAVPQSGPDTISLIYGRGLIGLQHDWCEAFPTYPRSFDLLHGIGLLSQELGRPNGCGLSNLFLEMDRILRPEGWVILRDAVELIEDARVAAGQIRWETRVIDVEGMDDQQLLVCQKTFWKNTKAAVL